jgi:hypothetical protein
MGILLDRGNLAMVEAATAEDADTVVVVGMVMEGADTEVLGRITVMDIKKHKFIC